MGDDVHVRAAHRHLIAGHESLPRLPPSDVEGGDDDIEARQHRIVIVEPCVGGDLELAAVQQAERGMAARRRVAGGDLAREPLVQLPDDAALLLDPLRGQAVGDGQALAMVGQTRYS